MNFVLSILLSLSVSTWAIGREVVAEVEAKVNAKGQATIQLKTPIGTHLNFEGPWRLEVEGLTPMGIEAFNKKTSTFELGLKDKKKAAYKLAYFLCSDDNSWCKRVENKGEIK